MAVGEEEFERAGLPAPTRSFPAPNCEVISARHKKAPSCDEAYKGGR